MHAITRKPLQGLTNIIRFNWHFYAFALSAILVVGLIYPNIPAAATTPLAIVIGLATISIITSLIVSYYIYDYSGLYTLYWLPESHTLQQTQIINIHAGFDETSALIARRYPTANLRVMDFYDPARHTEISVRRARQAYPPYPGTETTNTSNLTIAKNSTDLILGLFSFHEIRNRQERIEFLQQLQQALTEQGTLVLAEHLRDIPNALAYNMGCFHFLSEREWHSNFAAAGLRIQKQTSATPFITIFTLTRNHGGTP